MIDKKETLFNINIPTPITDYRLPNTHSLPGAKKEKIEGMFNQIASKYDFLNHFLSLGIDKTWRNKVVNLLKDGTYNRILDAATGTADLAISLCKLKVNKIIGVDISEKMLSIGREKIIKNKLEHKIELLRADSENLPFENNFFEAITIGFGLRNFENPEKGLGEFYRILQKGGRLVILEFSKPETFPFNVVFKFYFNFILPFIGKFISGDKSAYTYLPESVKKFPEKEEMLNLIQKNGFNDAKYIPLSFGICSIYSGIK